VCDGGVSAVAVLQGSIHHSSWGQINLSDQHEGTFSD
jgi:hypothetical protein